MNQTQRPLVMHKAILHKIWGQLLILATVMKHLITLATDILKKTSNRTIPVVLSTMNLSIEQRIALIVLALQTFLTPVLCTWRQGGRGLTGICGN